MFQTLSLWTVRLAVFCYVFACGVDLVSRFWQWYYPQTRRVVWTAGAALCVIHIVTALGGFHGFSHAESVRHTAEVTKRVVGLNWGGGVYVNYSFTVLWLWDAICHWRQPNRHTPVWLHVFMLFIVINATAVFGPTWYRWVAGLTLLLAAYVVTFRPAKIMSH